MTYVIRFFLKGKAKQLFFDFMQAELEWSIENLSKLLETELFNIFFDENTGTVFELGLEFDKFRIEAVQRYDAVKKHFVQIVLQIQSNFPEVIEGVTAKTVNEEARILENWTCHVCMNSNSGVP